MGSIMTEFHGASRKVVWQGTLLKTRLTIAGCVLGWSIVVMLTGLATLAALDVMMVSAEETGFLTGLTPLLFVAVCMWFLWMAWRDVQQGWIDVLGLPRTALLAIAAWGLVCAHVLSRADTLATPVGYMRISASDGHIYPSSERVARGLMLPRSFLLALDTELRVRWQQDKSHCDFTVAVRIEPGSSLEWFVSSNRIWSAAKFGQAAKIEIGTVLLSDELPKWVSSFSIRSSSCQFGNRT